MAKLKDKKWFQAIVKIAPKIAGALGGPFGGLAENVLESVLGLNQDEAMQQIAAGNPEVFAALKQAEIEFEERMREFDIEEQDLYLKDTADARAMRVATKDYTPAVLTGIALTFFFVLSWSVLKDVDIVQQNESFVMFLFGCASGWVTQGISFFLGSSRGSQKKTDMMAETSFNVAAKQ